MKTIKLALTALALAALPVALMAGPSEACKKCCKDNCAACCKDKGKKCGTDCCKGE